MDDRLRQPDKPARMTFAPELVRIAEQIRTAGGRAFAVGGAVRDFFMEETPKDIDVEVFGLSLERIERILQPFGIVRMEGKSFGILIFKATSGLEVDFSVPRRDNRVGTGHKGFEVEFDPGMTVQEAARRRDFTINSLSVDIITGDLVDPFGGLEDIKNRELRVIDLGKFVEDPLRILRGAQFIARFDLKFSAGLTFVLQSIDLSELPGDRILEEFKKLLLKGIVPSEGLSFLKECGSLQFFPVLEAMVGVEQDKEWHPEGNVWEHTLLVVDEAAALRTGDEREDLILMFAALLHDVGKPATTEKGEDGHIRSRGHEAAGAEPTRQFLESIRAPGALTDAVVALVVDHLAPHHLATGGAKRGAFRRLARRLHAAGTDVFMLHRLGTADHMGRWTPDALAREYTSGDLFLEKAKEAMTNIEMTIDGPQDVVLGRHLIARKMTPGPEFGPILARAREVADETGETDPDVILDIILAN